MIEVKEQALTEDLKKQIYEGFGKHAKAMTGHDENCLERNSHLSPCLIC